MKEKTVSFTTYGPNRGRSLVIGNYQFEDGICHIKEIDAAKAASILNNYHDVCFEHDLEAKAAEYDQRHGVAVLQNNTPVDPPEAPEDEQEDETKPPEETDPSVNEGTPADIDNPSDGDGTEANTEPPPKTEGSGKTTLKKQVNHEGKTK